MKPTVYIETSVVSYLTSQPSRDIITAARQQVTRDWWVTRRSRYELFVSEFVTEEAGSGDPKMARLRLKALAGIPEIKLPPEALSLGRRLVQGGPLPANAKVDALHIAAAVSAGVDYLMTWNFKHLANAVLKRKVEKFCLASGYEPCIICTPEELLED